MKSSALRLKGLVAATFTPFKDNGDIHLDLIERVVDDLVNQQIAGMYVLGSTGEGLSLTFDERCQVAKTFVEKAGSRIPAIIQVGHESLRQGAQLAAHAEQIGAAAVSAMAPVYFKPASQCELIDTLIELARAAPSLPFYYYHIPALTGINVDPIDFLRQAKEAIPNLAGIKFTAPQVHQFQACLELDPQQFEIMWGTDEMLLSGLAAGAQAAIGSTYNFAAPIYHRLIQHFERGEVASANQWQARAQAIVRTFVPFGRGSQKAIMSLIGMDLGPTRLPISTLTSEQKTKLHSELEKLGFSSWLEEATLDS